MQHQQQLVLLILIIVGGLYFFSASPSYSGYLPAPGSYAAQHNIDTVGYGLGGPERYIGAPSSYESPSEVLALPSYLSRPSSYMVDVPSARPQGTDVNIELRLVEANLQGTSRRPTGPVPQLTGAIVTGFAVGRTIIHRSEGPDNTISGAAVSTSGRQTGSGSSALTQTRRYLIREDSAASALSLMIAESEYSNVASLRDILLIKLRGGSR